MNNSFESWWKEWIGGSDLADLTSEMNSAGAAWDAQQKEIDRLREALEKIASYSEGDVVTNSFDSPHTARIAREALKDVQTEQ